MDFKKLKNRTQVPKYVKVLEKDKASNVVKTQRTRLYEYYRCDFCNAEIRLDKKQPERSGGIVIFPNTITKKGDIELALCNKCLVPTLKIFEKANL